MSTTTLGAGITGKQLTNLAGNLWTKSLQVMTLNDP